MQWKDTTRNIYGQVTVNGECACSQTNDRWTKCDVSGYQILWVSSYFVNRVAMTTEALEFGSRGNMDRNTESNETEIPFGCYYLTKEFVLQAKRLEADPQVHCQECEEEFFLVQARCNFDKPEDSQLAGIHDLKLDIRHLLAF